MPIWIVFSLAVMLLSGSALPSNALPVAKVGEPSASVTVRWQCNANRCLDPETGAYTASNCDRRGCYRTGGIVGYIDGRGRVTRSDRGYGDRGRYYRGGGQWECNENRCLDRRTGAYTASNCDRRGCYRTGGIVGYID